MTSLTALMRLDAGAGVTSAPVPTGDRFAALLAGDMTVAPQAIAVSGSPVATTSKLAPDPVTADALPIEVSFAAELPPSAPLTLPAARQPAATTGKALPAVTVDDARVAMTAPAKGRPPEPVPGSTGRQTLLVTARWTPEQVRGDDEAGASDVGKPVSVAERPVDGGSPAYVIATPSPLPVIVEAPAALSSDVAIGALAPATPAAVSIATPPPAAVPAEAPTPAPAATASDRALSPTVSSEAVRQNPVEGPRPAPAFVIAQPDADASAITTTVSMEQAIATIEAPRVAANHRSPSPEVLARPAPRDPIPQVAPLPAPVATPGTDRLLRARPNTAFAREEIAVTIGPIAPPPVTDAPVVRDAAPAQIDTQSSDWMHSMIERIETLTGEHGQRETRLKLSPDALGEVELRLRESPDGTLLLDMDAVTPEARALLAEAAPRLVEMGEARGLRLSMQTGGGASNGQQQHSREPHRPGADTALPNRRPVMTQGEIDDERIA